MNEMIIRSVKKWGVALAVMAIVVAPAQVANAAADDAGSLPAAQAATTCSRSWHTIRHGELNLALTVRGSGRVAALATPGVEPWYQWVQFCRDPNWLPNHYAIRSNVNGQYWYYDPNTASTKYVMGTDPAIQNTRNLFQIENFDGYWSTIQTVWQGSLQHYVEPDPASTANHLQAGPLIKNGHTLFRIEPPGDPLA